MASLFLNGRKQGIRADFSPVVTESTPPITAAGSDPATLGEAAVKESREPGQEGERKR